MWKQNILSLLLEIPMRRWEENIKMKIQRVGCGGMDWIKLAQNTDRWRTLVNPVMNLRFPKNAWNFLTSWETGSISRRTLLHEVRKQTGKTKQSEANRSQAKLNKAKRSEAKRSKVMQSVAKRSEAMQSLAKRTEVNRSEVKQSEAKRREAKLSEEVKRSKAKQSEAKLSEAK